MSGFPVELLGAEAMSYVSQRLRKLSVSEDAWEVLYLDDATGEEWVLDYPESELHGGGVPRLRRRGNRG